MRLYSRKKRYCFYLIFFLNYYSFALWHFYNIFPNIINIYNVIVCINWPYVSHTSNVACWKKICSSESKTRWLFYSISPFSYKKIQRYEAQWYSFQNFLYEKFLIILHIRHYVLPEIIYDCFFSKKSSIYLLKYHSNIMQKYISSYASFYCWKSYCFLRSVTGLNQSLSETTYRVIYHFTQDIWRYCDLSVSNKGRFYSFLSFLQISP